KRDKWITPLSSLSEASESVADLLEYEIRNSPPTPEEIAMRREKLREIVTHLQKHFESRRHSERDRIVLQKVLQGYSREEVAQQEGISVAMVSYIVRSAQLAVREQMKD